MTGQKSSLMRVWDRAIDLVNRFGHDEMDTCHLLHAILDVEDDPAGAVLRKYCDKFGRAHGRVLPLSMQIIQRLGLRGGYLSNRFSGSSMPPFSKEMSAVGMEANTVSAFWPGASDARFLTMALLTVPGPHRQFLATGIIASGVTCIDVLVEVQMLPYAAKNVVIIE